MEDEQSRKSEYRDVLSSFLKIIQNENELFSELALKAMEATDNIFSLRGEHEQKESMSHGNLAQDLETDELMAKVGRFRSKGENTLSHDKVVDLLRALETDSANKCKSIGRCECNAKTTKEVLDKARSSHTKDDRANSEVALTANHGTCGDDNECYNGVVKDEETVGTDNTKGKKLQSGKCSKPEEVDIKMVVRFPHEKLDSRHTQLKSFDSLPFNLLIAGELETITSGVLTEMEKNARTNMAKTICYHKEYLSDSELRNGYEDILKQVEQGALGWEDDLTGKLHEHFVFRANINLRNRIENDRFTTVSRKVDKMDNKTKKGNTEERIIYCQEFNKKTCIHQDHHEGRFMNKRVTKCHLCSKCLKMGEKRSHPGMDCTRQTS